ncbi:energy transducer TonB [candidate division NPL-UPA2 bacterium Unc8]|uniref:Energy transducer TonB n=1 Tax=candidate division NPL-UPA2 bacterium Unc8 TaxID=1980939 RepID=A0A399FUP5_UNCN2|nr:hypothetical protein [Bacillota bacterium]MBT9147562.1 hypothetical protein [Bacillota bacterium]RII00108.1 MAG: energy transducer TonB [candidate division NPL-UPA2 bacterium Unc8]
MREDKTIKTAFFISLAGHLLLFFGIPGFNLSVSQPEEPEKISIHIEIEIPPFLPAIDVVGEEKKLPKVEHKSTRAQEHQNGSEDVTDAMMHEYTGELIDEAMLRYQDMVKQKIESHLRYPDWAKRQRFEGTVYLSFIVLSDGQARDVKIIQSSGFDILDNEAVSVVNRATPFKPIPEKFNRSTLTMEVAIIFTLLEPA